jgi:hypothetical protein
MAAGYPAAFFLVRRTPSASLTNRIFGSISHTVFACGAVRLA